ncbi:MAG TPA: hypothetical protein VMW00_03870, partial [Dehalococcoidales bacterium]|nr:hypothetical protein [Dehalococcoidales bacterium]
RKKASVSAVHLSSGAPFLILAKSISNLTVNTSRRFPRTLREILSEKLACAFFVMSRGVAVIKL